ncbi:MAG: DUF6273 domain-containing protein, partial [Clostridia bacterium]|nr:DUF6273 domain-containing protein [Clostridia bacterium]
EAAKQANEELALLKAAEEERLKAEEAARVKAEEEASREAEKADAEETQSKADEEAAFRARLEKTFVPGATVSFGHYEQDANVGSGPEPLEWIVLSYDGQSAVMITRRAVDTIRYHRPSKAATWETSNIRQWLNDTFVADAFTDAERARLIPETLVNRDVAYGGHIVRGGPDTVDHVWLLSPEELERYLPKNIDRRAEITPYAESHGGWANKAGYCYWWLRSPVGGSTYSAKYAAVDGSVSSYAASAETRCVRPVIRVDVNDPDLF